jgi:carboxyl-terminal processing protease
MRILLILFVTISLSVSNLWAQDNKKEPQKWKGTTEQKIHGLMTIWSEVKFGFPYPEKLEKLDWNNRVKEYIPRVLAANDVEEYYEVLMEYVSLLKDSHTSVLPPWGYFKPGFDMPPLELQVIDNKFYIARVGDSKELKELKINPGLELLEVENTPIRKYFSDNVVKYYSQGSKQADEARLPFYILYGLKIEKVNLKIRDIDGNHRNVKLTRNSSNIDGAPFMYKFVHSAFVASTIDIEWIENNKLYVNIPNFDNPKIANDFQKLVDTLDTSSINGMILDVRYNMGGSSKNCKKIVECLIDKPVSSPLMHYPLYSAANKAWGKKEIWEVTHNTINPRNGKKYLGPLTIIIGPVTGSSAEDLAIELFTASRATIVGQKSCGGAGNTLEFNLPGSGSFKMATFKATYPDGTEYIGLGIKPDVEVYPTIEDIIDNNDKALDKCVELLGS